MKLPHITEYLSTSEVTGIYKSAALEEVPVEQQERKPDWKQLAKIIGTSALGTGVGTLAGFGALEVADRVLGGGGAGSSRMGIPASTLNKIVPIAGAGAGLTYTLLKLREMEKMRHALKPSTDNKPADQ